MSIPIIVNANRGIKYALGSFPSLIRFIAAPSNPPSVTKLKMPLYDKNRKYAPKIGAPTVCAGTLYSEDP